MTKSSYSNYILPPKKHLDFIYCHKMGSHYSYHCSHWDNSHEESEYDCICAFHSRDNHISLVDEITTVQCIKCSGGLWEERC